MHKNWYLVNIAGIFFSNHPQLKGTVICNQSLIAVFTFPIHNGYIYLELSTKTMWIRIRGIIQVSKQSHSASDDEYDTPGPSK